VHPQRARSISMWPTIGTPSDREVHA
jgi:hypothetical protein